MASSRLTTDTCGTESRTSSRTSSLRCVAALLTPRFTSSVRASSCSSVSRMGEVLLIRGPPCAASTTEVRNSASALSVRGFDRKLAPAASVRLTTSRWRLAEITATLIPGSSARSSAASVTPSLPGMLKSMSTISGESLWVCSSASAALVASNRFHSGCSALSTLATDIRASLLSSTINTLYVTRTSPSGAISAPRAI